MLGGSGNAALGNSIFDNLGNGVSIVSTAGDTALGNSIFDNGGLGIESDGARWGVIVNGASKVQAGTQVDFTVLSSLPNTPHLVEFFTSPAADPSGFGEGKTFLESLTITTDATGQATGSFTVAPSLAVGLFVTATATPTGLSTSAFSNAEEVIDPGPTVVGLSLVTPDPRSTPVDAIDVTFSEPIDAASLDDADVSLSLDGLAIPFAGPLTFQEITATTYRIGGLAASTTSDGRFTLAVDASGVRDLDGNAGTGAAATSWVMDTRPPTSVVNPLPQRATSLTFTVSVAASDPPAQPGGAVAGIGPIDLLVAVDGAPFVLWATLPSGTTSATLVAQSNHFYAFQSIAQDLAGNVESKPTAIEASTYVPDLTPPDTLVTSVTTTTATFTVSLSGTDAGGSGLSSFDLFVVVDGGQAEAVAHVTAGTPDAGGVYHRSVVYQAISDGTTHSYRFFTEGTDAAGNSEAAPSGSSDDVTVSAAFATPVSLQVTHFDVQRGLTERSYIRYLDVTFNRIDLLASLVADGRLRLSRFNLDGSGSGVAVPLVGARASGHVLKIDFGSAGIGGDPNSIANDGYYRLAFDEDGDGTFETSLYFYRLLGDITGDHVVDSSDDRAFQFATPRDPETDVNGDGVFNSIDLLRFRQSHGRRLGAGLHLDD